METTGYQFAGALKRLGGDEELFRELATYFIEDAPKLLHVIRVELPAGNAEPIYRARIVCGVWWRVSTPRSW